MSFLRQIWKKMINPTSLVGRDLEGNRYYEYINPESSRTKRVVKYRKGYDMWTYVAGGKRLPVQWSAWLTHTRRHPPTLEELQADLERQRRVVLGAAMIQARERQAVIAAAQVLESEPPPMAAVQEPLTSSAADSTWQGKPNPFAQVPKGTDDTQSWTPRAVRRS